MSQRIISNIKAGNSIVKPVIKIFDYLPSYYADLIKCGTCILYYRLDHTALKQNKTKDYIDPL